MNFQIPSHGKKRHGSFLSRWHGFRGIGPYVAWNYWSEQPRSLDLLEGWTGQAITSMMVGGQALPQDTKHTKSQHWLKKVHPTYQLKLHQRGFGWMLLMWCFFWVWTRFNQLICLGPGGLDFVGSPKMKVIGILRGTRRIPNHQPNHQFTVGWVSVFFVFFGNCKMANHCGPHKYCFPFTFCWMCVCVWFAVVFCR